MSPQELWNSLPPGTRVRFAGLPCWEYEKIDNQYGREVYVGPYDLPPFEGKILMRQYEGLSFTIQVRGVTTHDQ